MPNVREVAGTTSVLLLVAILCHAQEDKFDSRLKDVERNEHTTAGELYGPAFQKEFSTSYAARLNECATQTGGLNTESFDLLLKITASGTVEEALVRPKSPFSTCFMQLARKTTYPVPPSPGYWVAARMRFSKQ